MSFKIQYIAYEREPLFEGEGVVVSELDKPRSLDELCCCNRFIVRTYMDM